MWAPMQLRNKHKTIFRLLTVPSWEERDFKYAVLKTGQIHYNMHKINIGHSFRNISGSRVRRFDSRVDSMLREKFYPEFSGVSSNTRVYRPLLKDQRLIRSDLIWFKLICCVSNLKIAIWKKHSSLMFSKFKSQCLRKAGKVGKNRKIGVGQIIPY